jgi:Arc/MetJ-type ribon-helix-helix transcriptional regulator
MKTIAVSIDEPTLDALDRLVRKRRVRGKRSELVREALAEFLARREGQEREAIESAAIAKHRSLLNRQAKAMVTEQGRTMKSGEAAARKALAFMRSLSAANSSPSRGRTSTRDSLYEDRIGRRTKS